MRSSKKTKVKAKAPPTPKKIGDKFALLHIPSGQYLKLSTSRSKGEDTNAVLGYVSKRSLVQNFLNLTEPHRIELLRDSQEESIRISDLDDSRLLLNFKFPAIARTDEVDIYGMYRYWAYNGELESLEEFKKDPQVEVYCSIISTDTSKIQSLSKSSSIGDLIDDPIEYKITMENTSSWESIYEELFEYLQKHEFFVELSQFSVNKSNKEKIYLSEFEIIKRTVG